MGINQTWSPMFDLINVFEVFLPQLLLYPNPTDPLNSEAAALLIREPEAYNKKVTGYVEKYAKPEDIGEKEESDDDSLSAGDEDMMSDVSENEASTADM